jgi:hypothetical protein
MRRAALGLAVLFTLAGGTAFAEQAVSIGGGALGRALLDRPASPHGSVILIPGGDGVMNIAADGSFKGLRGNQLVRTRASYAAHGLAVLTVDRDVDLNAAITYMRKIASPVALVGTSRGTLRAAEAVAAGAKPDAVVLTSGFLDSVRQTIGSPARLPRTLVVHHRQDGCRFTPPGAVEPFRQWGGGKVSVTWLDGGPGGKPVCQARSFHGFQGLDGAVVATVSRFVAGR